MAKLAKLIGPLQKNIFRRARSTGHKPSGSFGRIEGVRMRGMASQEGRTRDVRQVFVFHIVRASTVFPAFNAIAWLNNQATASISACHVSDMLLNYPK
ncbi:hypothetical protein A0U89_09400 [Kozakia baliensis]|uniref:Uncharacterized protein n=1 Tax=Kozakia baliensis TaxID=153496 RepID=A0A1D8UUJ3_9PROT|nr:hypothetical protein A0U89_09400 [Kozakia baliensis]